MNLENLSESKTTKEIEKLDLEIKDLKRHWMKRPQVLLGIATALAALVGVGGQSFISCRQLTQSGIQRDLAEVERKQAELNIGAITPLDWVHRRLLVLEKRAGQGAAKLILRRPCQNARLHQLRYRYNSGPRLNS